VGAQKPPHVMGLMSTYGNVGAESHRGMAAHSGFKRKARRCSGFKLESVKSGAHESGAGLSAAFRSNPIRHGGWRRLAPQAVRCFSLGIYV